MHGHLVKIETEEENEEVYREAVRRKMTKRDTWIGLNDAAKEGNWVWTSGERANFTNWGKGEPNNFNDGEDCAVLRTQNKLGVPRKWNDAWCSIQNGAICELIL